jgi:large exoprotein involved in heme utilization and adhesion
LNNDGFISADTSGQGNAGSININATESITLDNSKISSEVGFDIEGNGGELKITTPNLSLTNGGFITGDTYGQGDASSIDINATESITLDNNGSISSTVRANVTGNGGELKITTPNLSLTNESFIVANTYGKGDGGSIDINATESITLDNGTIFSTVATVGEEATGNGGELKITTPNLSLTNESLIATGSSGEGDAGSIDINANILSLDNSRITAQAFSKVDGGNLEIDADVIAAFPNGNSDIRASAEQGEGGNITIDADSLFGIEERPLNDSTNDINASSEFALDGSVNVNVSNINPVQGATELPSNVVEPEQTTAQTCQAGGGTANNGLAIAGKGGVPPAPDTPLNSENIIISSEQNPAASAIPEPIETSQGKIQPARGIRVTESGNIVLTAYRTNNAGERIPEGQINCGQR